MIDGVGGADEEMSNFRDDGRNYLLFSVSSPLLQHFLLLRTTYEYFFPLASTAPSA